jgi:hypothetical protein
MRRTLPIRSGASRLTARKRDITVAIIRFTSVLVLAAGVLGARGAAAETTPGGAKEPEALERSEDPTEPSTDVEELQRQIEILTEEIATLKNERAPKAGDADESAAAIEELQRQILILAEEVEKLRSGEKPEVEINEDDARTLGLAPSAASLYGRDRGVSLAGYGEMLYEDFASENESGESTGGGAQADFLRAIVYFGYRFNDKFLFNSEIEIEHADEIFLEFAYVDYLATDKFGLRGGLLLLPMGLVNEFHEPNVFIGAKRPETEQRIIPTTWRENGLGVHGAAGKVAYRGYVVNGLRASGFSAGGIRGGRQKGSKALADNLAFTGRLDVMPTPGVFVGASLYTGGSGQGEIALEGESFRVRTTIFDVHGQAQIRGFDLRGLYAQARIDDAEALNRSLGLEGPDAVAEKMLGGYVQLGYNVLSQVSSTRISLLPYYRWERIDTQATMPDGFERSGATRRTLNSIGVELKPIPNIVLKVDYQIITNDAKTGRNQLNVNLGYAF